MRNRVICLFCLAVMALFLAAGCETTFEQKERDVKFTATSKGSVFTKTAYGNEDGGYAIIEWKANDQIRIYSPNTNYLMGSGGDAGVVVGGGEGQTQFEYVYDDYTLIPSTISGHIHNATLENIPTSDDNPDGRGLYWNLSGTTSDDKATFYSAYPTNIGVSWYSNGLSFDLKIPNRQSVTFDANGVHTPSISSLPLLAMQQNVQSGDQVNLEFYPAFSAFEFNLKSEDLITLNSFTLETASDTSYVTGTCIYNPALPDKKSGEFYIMNHEIYFIAGEYWAQSSYELCSKSLTVNFPTGTQIGPVDETTSKEVTFTLFALPNDLDQVSITVNLTADGLTTSRKLKLQQKDSNSEFQWITFPAGHKARIKGLAVDKGSKWQLQIDDQVLPWIADVQTTSFRNQIGITGRTPVGGFIETTEVNEPGGPVNWPLYYTRLTVNCNVPDPCIEFTFTPTAPIGGYWRLSPEDVIPGSLNYFKITTSDLINGESERLQGQVMVQPVTIYIRPTAEYLALDPAPVYSIIIHCDMSPSVTFDPLFSADSEFQRPYSDGRFGYYKFVIAK